MTFRITFGRSERCKNSGNRTTFKCLESKSINTIQWRPFYVKPLIKCVVFLFLYNEYQSIKRSMWHFIFLLASFIYLFCRYSWSQRIANWILVNNMLIWGCLPPKNLLHLYYRTISAACTMTINGAQCACIRDKCLYSNNFLPPIIP